MAQRLQLLLDGLNKTSTSYKNEKISNVDQANRIEICAGMHTQVYATKGEHGIKGTYLEIEVKKPDPGLCTYTTDLTKIIEIDRFLKNIGVPTISSIDPRAESLIYDSKNNILYSFNLNQPGHIIFSHWLDSEDACELFQKVVKKLTKTQKTQLKNSIKDQISNIASIMSDNMAVCSTDCYLINFNSNTIEAHVMLADFDYVDIDNVNSLSRSELARTNLRRSNQYNLDIKNLIDKA